MNFYIRADPPQRTTLRWGHKIIIEPFGTFYVDKRGSGYFITEPKSGYLIEYGYCLRDAITGATRLLDRNGPEGLARNIAEVIAKYGELPRTV